MVLIRAHSADALAAFSDRHHRATFSLAHRRLDDAGQAEAIVPVGWLVVGCHPGRDDADRGQLRASVRSTLDHRALMQVTRQPASRSAIDREEGLSYRE